MSNNPNSASYYSRIKELEARVLFLEYLLAFASRPGTRITAHLDGCIVHEPPPSDERRPIHHAQSRSSLEEALGKALQAESNRPG